MQQINNLSSRMQQYQHLIETATQRVITSGWWILGPECNNFERSFAEYLMIEHCIGVANGTDAIELALKALGVIEGDRVATVANAGMYTTSAILAIKAQPFFMDVDLTTSCVNLSEVKRAVDADVKVIVVTHLYGQAAPDILEIAQYCRARNVYLIEDCAQAHGAKIHGQYAGSFGDVSSFSFYPTKNLGALGDGGAVVTNNSKIAQQVRQLRQYGWSSKYKVEIAGARNSRLDEIQAAILTELLPFLDASNTRRRQIAKRYQQFIKHPYIIKPSNNGEDYVAHLYVIRCKYRDLLQAHLKEFDIASEIHYPIPDYLQPLFADQFSHVSLENTKELTQQILTLPCYPEMTDEQVDRVIEVINGWQI